MQSSFNNKIDMVLAYLKAAVALVQKPSFDLIWFNINVVLTWLFLQSTQLVIIIIITAIIIIIIIIIIILWKLIITITITDYNNIVTKRKVEFPTPLINNLSY